MIEIVNLTPHEIRIQTKSGEEIVIPPSGTVLRTQVQHELIGEIEGIPVYKIKYGKVENLPERKEGTIYLVSMPVKDAVPDREDICMPDTSPPNVIRDEKGNIKAVKAIVCKIEKTR
ncbi:MAG: hypothetical protein QXG39_03280 [Candidatus Aenigmatarchaeota archaeon]